MYVCIPILVSKPVLCSSFLFDPCLCSCYYELILWCSCYYELDYDQGCRKSKSIFKEMVERPGILKPWKFLGQDPLHHQWFLHFPMCVSFLRFSGLTRTKALLPLLFTFFVCPCVAYVLIFPLIDIKVVIFGESIVVIFPQAFLHV